jgi:hypothetical protein
MFVPYFRAFRIVVPPNHSKSEWLAHPISPILPEISHIFSLDIYACGLMQDLCKDSQLRNSFERILHLPRVGFDRHADAKGI